MMMGLRGSGPSCHRRVVRMVHFDVQAELDRQNGEDHCDASVCLSQDTARKWGSR